jgi:hypothetical protein
LFHGIKPVFVFDGGAPVLKRSTIVSTSMNRLNERRIDIRPRGNGKRLEQLRTMLEWRRNCLRLK